MKQNLSVPGLRISVWFYGWFLKMHSPWFRVDCGDEMLLHHEVAYCVAWNKEGLYGVIELWRQECMALVPDLFKEFEQQYQAVLRQEVPMRDFLCGVAVFSSVVLMVIAGAVSGLIWASLGANGTFYSGIDQTMWFIILFDGAIAVVGLLCLGFWKTVAGMLN